MHKPSGPLEAAHAFARAVVECAWADVLPLLSRSLRQRVSIQSLADEFGWSRLEPRLQQMHSEIAGAPPQTDCPLDPPTRFEAFEVDAEVVRKVGYPPVAVETYVVGDWVKVYFRPAEDSGYDECYRCVLGFVDEDGPRISTYTIQSTTE